MEIYIYIYMCDVRPESRKTISDLMHKLQSSESLIQKYKGEAQQCGAVAKANDDLCQLYTEEGATACSDV